MNHTEAAQYIKATLTAFGPGEAISMTKETWAKIHEAMQVLTQPEQEPVGWVDDGGLVFWKDKPPEDDADLYTTPPQPEQEPVVQWHLSKDGLPPVGSEVVGGYFYKDTWLKGEPEVFAWGQCRVIKDDHPDFPDGKRWITFGPSHNQITYWCWPPKKPGDTSPPQPEQSQVEETLRYEIDALEAKLAECRAQQEHVATSDTSEKRVDEMAKQRHEQEPVVRWICKGCGHEYMEAPSSCDCMDSTEYDRIEYYTTPPKPEPVIDKSAATRIATSLGWEPKRTWVGLTDEEISDLWDEVVKYAPSEVRIKDFARAIEAAHGVKE